MRKILAAIAAALILTAGAAGFLRAQQPSGITPYQGFVDANPYLYWLAPYGMSWAGGAASIDPSGNLVVKSCTGCGGTPAVVQSYYMGPDGSDSNDGKTPQTAWHTFNHAQGIAKCGQLVTVLPGFYNGPTITVSAQCPSGNDGVLYQCSVDHACGATQITVEASYITIMGFQCDTGSTCFSAVNPSSGTNITNVAFVDDIARNASQGGIVYYNNGSSNGVANQAAIENWVYNSSKTTSNCDSGISLGHVVPFTGAPTQGAYAGFNVSNDNKTTGCLSGQNSDNTGITVDTPKAPLATALLENNYGVGNGTAGIEEVSTFISGACTISSIVRNNTVWGNNQMANVTTGVVGMASLYGELQLTSSGFSGCITAIQNIAVGTQPSFVVSATTINPVGVAWGTNASDTQSAMGNNVLYQTQTGFGIRFSGAAISCLDSTTAGPYTNTTNVGCDDDTFTTNPVLATLTDPGDPGGSCLGISVTQCAAAHGVQLGATGSGGLGPFVGARRVTVDANNGGNAYLCHLFKEAPAGSLPAIC